MISTAISTHPTTSKGGEEASYSLLTDDEAQSVGCLHGRSSFILGRSRLSCFKPYFGNASGLLIVIFYTLIIAIIASFTTIILYRPSDQYCARRLSLWSPVLDAVEYISLDFDNEFAHKTKYRGPPTEDVESAWHELTNKHEVLIDEEKLSALNRSLATNPANAEVSGRSGYRANIEVFHQLHCLNLIRQYTWFQAGKYHDHPPSTLAVGSDVARRMHVDHCIETVRLALICNADVTPMISVVDHEDSHGYRADFNAHHKCRDFAKIEAWMERNAVQL
ncbi:hypothetical protein GGR57DRAFT_515806 [Xylariaceae sp. FL1272]|nr:hypothetical protein GGR57DRAFT_515806 [Xylariaceae sp. FL1272]